MNLNNHEVNPGVDRQENGKLKSQSTIIILHQHHCSRVYLSKETDYEVIALLLGSNAQL